MAHIGYFCLVFRWLGLVVASTFILPFYSVVGRVRSRYVSGFEVGRVDLLFEGDLFWCENGLVPGVPSGGFNVLLFNGRLGADTGRQHNWSASCRVSKLRVFVRFVWDGGPCLAFFFPVAELYPIAVWYSYCL